MDLACCGRLAADRACPNFLSKLIVDAVGVCKRMLNESRPLEKEAPTTP